MDIAGDIALFEAIKARVGDAVVPACDAIGDTYKSHLVDYTLIESGQHGPATEAGYPPSGPEGGAPMMMTGRLRDTVIKTPATGGGGVAECSVSPTTIYANTVHWGGDHHGQPLMVLWQRYVGYQTAKRKGWLKTTTHHLSHPYMIIAVNESMASGILSRAGADSFEAHVWG